MQNTKQVSIPRVSHLKLCRKDCLDIKQEKEDIFLFPYFSLVVP